MRPKRSKAGGFSFLEVMVALALIVTGAMIGLTMIINTSAQNEITREQAIIYKGCQDVMEALMNMDKATFLAQEAWQKGNGGKSPFSIPKVNPKTPPTGYYTLTDISKTLDAAAPVQSIYEIKVYCNYKKINVMVSSWRYLP
jgi:Tfp pilus assembly protein PilV